MHPVENDQAATHGEILETSTTPIHTAPILPEPSRDDEAIHLSLSVPTNVHLPLNTILKEIRVLRIENISTIACNGPLQCSVEHVSLSANEDLNYHAISYCWGGSSVNETIMLDETEVYVPQSAITALRGILHCHHDVCRLWIDAICINQDDPAEKAQQIAIMGDVYSKARSVLVWLGEDNGSTEAAIRIVDQVVNNFGFLHKKEDEAFHIPDTEVHQARMLLNDSKVLSEVLDWSPLWTFFESPWFSRVWVMQEVALARHAACYCGKLEISWNSITTVVNLVSRIYEIDTAWFTTNLVYALKSAAPTVAAWGWLNTTMLSHIMNMKQDRRIAFQWLAVAGPRNVTNPHDKLYGILGVMKHTDPTTFSSLMPDYDKSLKEIYGEAAWLCMSSANSLDHLVWAQFNTGNETIGDRRFEDFPSWVPSFHSAPSSTNSGPSKATKVSKADAEVTPHISRHPPDLDWLHNQGVMVDRVESSRVVFEVPAVIQSARIEKLLGAFVDYIIDLVATGEVPGPRLKDFACTIVQGSYRGLDVEEATNLIPDFCSFILKCLQEALSSCDARLTTLPIARREDIIAELTAESTKHSGSAEHFMQTLMSHVQSQAYVKTHGDRLGVGPATLKEDDYLCILYGAKLPFIMRKAGTNWKIIGCCYVRSIAKGEFVRDLIERNQLEATSQIFTIC